MSPIALALQTPLGPRSIPVQQVATVLGAPGDPAAITLLDGSVVFCSDPISEVFGDLISAGTQLAVFTTSTGLRLGLVTQALTGIEASGEGGTVITLFTGSRYRLQERFVDVLLRLQTLR